MHSTPYSEFLAPCCIIAREAGAIIMRYFHGDFATQHKPDQSPVTDADKAANQYIVEALKRLTPDIPIVAEEDESIPDAAHVRFWLVDPLDGTRSFVRREEEFTVNIGLVENGRPRLGIICHPPTETLYWGGENIPAARQARHSTAESITARQPPEALVVTRSRSHPSKKLETYLQTIRVGETIPASGAIKFCWVAEGRADLYPRLGQTMEWDTAAGQAILEAAGGCVETLDGKPLTYGKPHFENPGFIAYGK